MIESRRGHREHARRLLDRAQKAIAEVEPKKPDQAVGGSTGPTDWVELAVLRHEAESAIEPAAAPTQESSTRQSAGSTDDDGGKSG
jgi:hypothetical protein